MVSHIHYNFNANKEFLIYFTSKFITSFIDIHVHAFGFTSGMKSLSIVCLLRGSEHID